MTSHDAMLSLLIDALEDSAAGYAYVAEESDGFSFYAYCGYQAFERRRLAALLAAQMAVLGSTAHRTGGASEQSLVKLRIALTHGSDTVVKQLQRSDERLAHMLQASLVDGQLSGAVAQTVRGISDAIHDAQAELRALTRSADGPAGILAREAA